MRQRIISPRETAAWALCFLVVAVLLVRTQFASTDPDSALYAGLADRLSQEPVSRWLAPEWWGFWPEAQMTGLFREHPAGVLLLPAALSRFGIPAVQASYVVGIGAGLASLLLMASLVNTFTDRRHARLALILLQLMPVAFIFRIRANHEYPMLVCLLIAVHGLVAASKNQLARAAVLLSAGLTLGLFIKGVFAINILLAVVVWIVTNPLPQPGARARAAISTLAACVVALAGAIAYEHAYRAATSEPFWTLYWQRQLGPLAEVSAIQAALAFARNLVFYLSRLVWHPAPWSLAILIAGWRLREAGHAQAAPLAKRGLMFALIFAGLAIVLLAPSARYAERYAFPSTHAIACAGAALSAGVWPAFSSRITDLDRRIPALPALLWLGLAVGRLLVGSVR